MVPKSSSIAASERTLRLAGMTPVKMAGLMIYLMDVYNWKDDAMCHYQQSNGDQPFDKGHLHHVKIHEACASYIYVRASLY